MKIKLPMLLLEGKEELWDWAACVKRECEIRTPLGQGQSRASGLHETKGDKKGLQSASIIAGKGCQGVCCAEAKGGGELQTTVLKQTWT